MIGVKFTRPMGGHGAGDTRLMPSRESAEAFVRVSDGAAELHTFPDHPHAHEAGYVVPTTKPQPTGQARAEKLTIKKK